MREDSLPGSEDPKVFEQRKADHIKVSMDPRVQAGGPCTFDSVHLIHEAIPDLDWDQLSTRSQVLGRSRSSPFLISSMTAGHVDASRLNVMLARAASQHGWLMGVGSQRRELFDPNSKREWALVREAAPEVELLGNLGLSQLIETPIEKVQELVDNLRATAMIIHTNPLQEVIQPEGTPRFRGGMRALTNLCSALKVPVIVKETGCGFSDSTLLRLNDVGLAAVDVGGWGGTHWGRIEGLRSGVGTMRDKASETFLAWGHPTIRTLWRAQELKLNFELWGSGGVRSGLDAAKCLALGATAVGVAQPIMEAALQSENALQECMNRFEFELKCALFCSGAGDIKTLRQKRFWSWQDRS